jgi:hypothetical protein
MGLFSKNHKSSKFKNDIVDYVFYKILDFDEYKSKYIIQCIKTNTVFESSINEILSDLDILYYLHPIQACYIGIEYAKKNNVSIRAFKSDSTYSSFRYGDYYLYYQDRKGLICFINKLTNEEFFMPPCDIAFSKEIIEKFDAIHAFYIGYSAGLESKNKKTSPNKFSYKNKDCHLIAKSNPDA